MKLIPNKNLLRSEIKKLEDQLKQQKDEHDIVMKTPVFSPFHIKRNKQRELLCTKQKEISQTTKRLTNLKADARSAILTEDKIQTICAYIKMDLRRIEGFSKIVIHPDKIPRLKNSYWLDNIRLATTSLPPETDAYASSPVEGYASSSQLPNQHTWDFRSQYYSKLFELNPAQSPTLKPGEVRRKFFATEVKRMRSMSVNESQLTGWRSRSPSPTN